MLEKLAKFFQVIQDKRNYSRHASASLDITPKTLNFHCLYLQPTNFFIFVTFIVVS